MTAHEVLHEARRLGIVLTPSGTSLRFRGPKNALSDELKRDLLKHKPEIMGLLVEAHVTYACDTCGQFAFALPTTCYWCRRAAEVPHEA